MSQTNILRIKPLKEALSVPVLGVPAKALWTIVLAVTVLTEVIPVPLMLPPLFYSYSISKVVAFIVLGYLTPLALRRFDALKQGILLATMSAAAVEALQGLLHHGHSFHWYELGIKLLLISGGFALALEARYDHKISLGPINIPLTGQDIR
jgi:glycopeptide antibiotics resistance protein